MRRLVKGCVIVFTAALGLTSCKDNSKEQSSADLAIAEKDVVIPDVYEFGFNLNDYIVKRDTVHSGDSFGQILERNNIGFSKIYQIAEKTRDSFDIRKIQIGKPYTLLCAKDSLETPKCFIYQPNKEEYVVVNFQDSIHAYTSRKPIKYVEKEYSGIINSNISQTLADDGLSLILAYKMSDIYAWTIDFTRLQKGDRFKVIYTDKYIDDTIYAGIDKIKAAYFEHNTEPFYAFEFETDSVIGTTDFYNEEAKTLRRAFLKAPVEYKRISSRFNLNRRIALYGNKVRPHKGTDFAANIGTPIVATANGVVTKSSYTGGNGNYVKIRHNKVYETQYLHMQKRKVKVGEYVKQGDVIGWVGMTGNTSGPHVCYRFWKNGEQVDPFKQKLPAAEPILENLKDKYLEYIKPIKVQMDAIPFSEDNKLKEEQNLITQAY
ncbi:peptidoglycan DD-metalloendopeptidase family protein [Formosa sediminum]|uniref:Peptidoglycan DD-metalloendopeptidase family protein n=1 Tax=Formosa sediminum TaxID=2594004 RepID=A0A516GPG8_9FLAO|nr:peptidoglycan DD-metalloendopeptidase family protein [Formosa sediminum]QDO93418.1 peptidoglycan DD-metalloendopeptidase family protein [Formosa sediminum]